MLKQRVITAAILIPITLFILFYSSAAVFLAFTAIVVLGCAWEWSNLMGLKNKFFRFIYLIFIALMLLLVFFVPIQLIFTIAFFWWVLAACLIFLYPRFSTCWGSGFFWRGVMGACVLAPCFVALNYIRNQHDGLYSLLFLFVLIWGADSAAYFVGKKWGRAKLAPYVSPGKSWQGLLGALLCSGVIACIAFWLSNTPKAWWFMGITFAMMTVLFSVIGDLFESMLKRQVGLKDSGKLLPGHGGLLDRLDSLTAAAPVFVFLGQLMSIH